MKKEVKNLKASIKAQLMNKAKESNRPFSEVLQYYGIERFLYRVSTLLKPFRTLLKPFRTKEDIDEIFY